MSKILVISPTPSHPQNAGSRVRIFNLFDSLKQQGHEIHFVYVTRERGGDEEAMQRHWDAFYALEYTQPQKHPVTCTILDTIRKRIWKNAVVPWRIDDWYDPAIDSFVIELQRKIRFDAVFVEYVFFSKALQCFDSNVVKIIDTIDVFTNRHKFYEKYREKPGFFYTTRAQERIGLNRADVVIAIQEEEKAFFSKLVKKKVITVGHPVQLHAPKTVMNGDSRRLLFVGSINMSNIKSMSFFLDKIFPQLQQRYPDIRLDIVGNMYTYIYSDLKQNLPEGCFYHGEVEELRPYYQHADIVINPMLFATGLNIKMIEALGHSIPVVTTSMGCRGLEQGKDRAFLVADTPEEFAQAVSRILEDSGFAHILAQNAYDFAKQYNYACMQSLTEVLGNNVMKNDIKNEAGRRASLNSLLTERPKFHGRENAGTQHYAISDDVLTWIFENLPQGSNTLETGCGYSTVVFSLLSCYHTAISPFSQEHEVIKQWCVSHSIPINTLEFIASPSQSVIHTIDKRPLDMVLIDGDHAFPAPFIDWYYTADMIKCGGLLIVDDTQLTTGKILKDFLLEETKRWKCEAKIDKTIVFKKLVSSAVAEGIPWIEQPYVKNVK